MGNLLSNSAFVDVSAGIVTAILLAIVAALYHKIRTPSIHTLYNRALSDISGASALNLNPSERKIVGEALKDPEVVEATMNAGLGPEIEHQLLCQALARLAPTGTRLADKPFAEKVVDHLLRREHVLQGRHQAYASRTAGTHIYFSDARLHGVQPDLAGPKQEAGPKSAAPASPSTFFIPPEALEGRAEACIGRQQDLARLQSSVDDPSQRLIVIEGFGGVGKTTLAAKLATNMAQKYRTLWVDCNTLLVTPERLLREIAQVALSECDYPWLDTITQDNNISEAEKITGLIEFVTYLSKSDESKPRTCKPLALFFDDYQAVKHSSIDNLIAKVADCRVDVKIVLTIRNRLHLSTELQSQVNWSNSTLVEGLSLDECRSFLAERSSGFPALAHINEKLLQQIWQRTGQGVPTALVLFVPLTRNRSVEDLLATLPNYDPLSAASNEWFDNLFAELSDDGKQVVSEAAIFRRPVPRQALLYISLCAHANEAIDELTDRFVLTFDNRSKIYSMHALWSEYAKRHLSAGDTQTLHVRAATFYRELQGDRYSNVMNGLESCYHFLQAGDTDEATSVLKTISDTLRSWGLFQEFTDLFVEIERESSSSGKPLDPGLRIAWASILQSRGELDAAAALLRELVEQTTGEIQLTSLQELGWVTLYLGNRVEAATIFKKSVDLAHDQGLLELEGEGLRGLHNVSYGQSNYEEALKYDAQRLTIAHQLPGNSDEKDEIIAHVFRDDGNIYREQGLYAEAMGLYEQDREVLRNLNDPPFHLGWLLYDMGQVEFERQKLDKAQEYFQQSLDIFTHMPQVQGMAHAKVELGRVASLRGDRGSALNYLEDAIELCRRAKIVPGEAYALRGLGEAYLNFKDPDAALPYLQKSLSIDEQSLHGTKGMASSWQRIGLAYEQQGMRLLTLGDQHAASAKLHDALQAVTRAQGLFASLHAIPNFGGILTDLERIQKECDPLR